MLRFVKIAFSALFVAISLLLVASWMRSYYVFDAVRGHLFSSVTTTLGSMNGRLAISRFASAKESQWSWHSTSRAQFRTSLLRNPQLMQLRAEFLTISRSLQSLGDSSKIDLWRREYSINEARLVEKITAESGFPQTEWSFGFGFLQFVNGWVVTVPYWFLTILAAAMSVIPWIRWRFSLRSLLIIVTLICVVLGVVLSQWQAEM